MRLRLKQQALLYYKQLRLIDNSSCTKQWFDLTKYTCLSQLQLLPRTQ